MAEQVCVVCHIRPGVKAIGGRVFCDEHYTKALYKRSGVWRSAAFAVIGLLVFVALVVALDAVIRPQALTGVALLTTGLLLAIVPAVLWLVFFYQQDRLEPEPVGEVAKIFVIGLALGGALGIPLTDQVFHVPDWLYRDTLTTVLGSIFVIGGVQAFVVYAAVRYFIFSQPEFDERTDGVVYGTAAALGYATALNLQFILASGGAALGPAEIYVAEVALAQAAFGGLLGYFLGKAKLERDPIWWLPLGLAVTALLNGLFNLLRGQLDTGAITKGSAAGLPSIGGLLLAGALAVIVTIAVSWLINRDIARSLANSQNVEADPARGDRQANYAVMGTFIVLLALGALAWNNAVNRTKAFEKGDFKGAYPAQYSEASTQPGEVLHVVDTLGTGVEFAIQTVPLQAGQSPEAVALQLAGDRGTDYAAYKVIETSAAKVEGSKDALVQRFAYVETTGLVSTVPQVREGVDYIVQSGSQAVVITLLASPDEIGDAEPLFTRFLNSLSFQ